MSRKDVPSPCTGRCGLDAARERCTGCARTPDEIRRWHRGTPAERAAILAAVREREAGMHRTLDPVHALDAPRPDSGGLRVV